MQKCQQEVAAHSGSLSEAGGGSAVAAAASERYLAIVAADETKAMQPQLKIQRGIVPSPPTRKLG